MKPLVAANPPIEQLNESAADIGFNLFGDDNREAVSAAFVLCAVRLTRCFSLPDFPLLLLLRRINQLSLLQWYAQLLRPPLC